MVRCPLCTQKLIWEFLFMVTDIQKASLWKRASAGLFDLILLAMLTVGMAALLSSVFNYNAHYQKLADSYVRYEQRFEEEYGVKFRISQEEYDAMTTDERSYYDEACKAAQDAFSKDSEVIYEYNLVMNLTLLITTFALLISVLLMEFFIPLFFKNGQTLGKKIFAIAVIRPDGVKASNVQLFVRTLLGKFTIELMIPIYILLMILFNSASIISLAILAAILLSQIISMIVSKTNNLIHDSISGTVTVDFATQMIFSSGEERIEYIKRLHAQETAKKEY